MSVSHTVEDVAKILGASVHSIRGSLTTGFSGVASLTALRDRPFLSFCSHPGEGATQAIRASAAVVVICQRSPAFDEMEPGGKTLVFVENPRLCFMKVAEALFVPPRLQGVHETAVVHAQAQLGRGVYVGPNAVIGSCKIGDNTTIFANVTLFDGVRVGNNVIINSGTVIGGDGFGFERDVSGEPVKFPHFGGVVIEDNVEIGSNTSIDRGTLGDTHIKAHAKIDNLVHIAHNVVVGKGAFVIAHAMVAGSTKIGDYSWVAPCVTVRDKITVGANALLGLGAVVVKDVADGQTVMGAPARSLDEHKELQKALKWLVEEFRSRKQ